MTIRFSDTVAQRLSGSKVQWLNGSMAQRPFNNPEKQKRETLMKVRTKTGSCQFYLTKTGNQLINDEIRMNFRRQATGSSENHLEEVNIIFYPL